MNRQALDDLKQQIPLLDYLQAHDWQPGAAPQPWPMDGAVPFAWRSQTQLPGGSQQKPVLLLRLWPRRRRDSLCRTLSPGEVPASPGIAAPMARRGRPCCTKLRVSIACSYTATRGGCLSAPTRTPLAGTDRAHAHRLRAGRLPARLADAVGLPAPGSASSRFGYRRGIRHLHASHRLSAGRQSLWPQPLGGGAAASVSCRAPRAACTRGSKSGNIRK